MISDRYHPPWPMCLLSAVIRSLELSIYPLSVSDSWVWVTKVLISWPAMWSATWEGSGLGVLYVIWVVFSLTSTDLTPLTPRWGSRQARGRLKEGTWFWLPIDGFSMMLWITIHRIMLFEVWQWDGSNLSWCFAVFCSITVFIVTISYCSLFLLPCVAKSDMGSNSGDRVCCGQPVSSTKARSGQASYSYQYLVFLASQNGVT